MPIKSGKTTIRLEDEDLVKVPREKANLDKSWIVTSRRTEIYVIPIEAETKEEAVKLAELAMDHYPEYSFYEGGHLEHKVCRLKQSAYGEHRDFVITLKE